MTSLKPLARDLVADSLYATGITRPQRVSRHRLTVVTFHRVLPAVQRDAYPIPEIAVTPDELGWCLDFFGQHFTCGTLREMAGRSAAGEQFDRPALAITFDDGQLDNFVHARPQLEQRGLRASFFIPVEAVETGTALWHDRLAAAAAAWFRKEPDRAAAALDLPQRVAPGEAVSRALAQAKLLSAARRLAWVAEIEDGSDQEMLPAWNRMMDWEQLRALASSGHEIGSHSMTHPILPLCADDELDHEIAGSREVLARRLGANPTTFCYPNGDHDERSVAAVARAGYRWAVTTRWGTNGRDAPPLTLKRCDIDVARVRTRRGVLSEAQLAWRLSGLHPGLR